MNDPVAARSSSGPLENSGTEHGVFVTTHWSIVLSAQAHLGTRSSEALEALCRSYWYPLYAYVRWSGHSPADAEDLTQAFFACLLEKDYLRAADREKGRFRTFLLMALKRFMANEYDRAHAKKRGGFTQFLPIDHDFAESRYAADPATGVDPERVFDRHWARTVLDRTLARLREEYATTGRAQLFEHLANSLDKDSSALSYAEIAHRLNLTEAAVKMAVYRMRRRYRELLLSEITQTVANPQDAQHELQQLFEAFQ